jgi:hypothetical protein
LTDLISKHQKARFEDSFILLVLVSEVFFPLLNWKLNLPAEVRWVSQFSVLVLDIIGLYRSLKMGNFPKAILWGIGVLILWGSIGILWSQQGITSTVWGGYMLFLYPLLGLYAYTRPQWEKRLPGWIINLCALLLIINVGIQIIQYVTGEIPGDSLAGFFGANSVGNLAVFIVFTLSLWLGKWIILGKRTFILIILFGLGIFASVLGEMKIVIVMVVWISIFALFILMIKTRRIGAGLFYVLCLIASLWGFASLYDQLIPQANTTPITYYLNWNNLYNYLNRIVPGVASTYTVGRITDLTIAWEQINKTTFNLFLGYGMGSHSVGTTLGVAGNAFGLSDLGVYTGTSLATYLGEYGLVGIMLLAVFLIWLFVKFFYTNDFSISDRSLAVGLAIYTSSLPIWLFYHNVWSMPVTNIFYWLGVGYILKMKKYSIIIINS